MKISRALPQFERYPALFITSGEYEAHFYIAYQGEIAEKDVLKLSPRENAKEKQGFIGHKSGMKTLSSVSHRGQYVEDLKKKFSLHVSKIIKNILDDYKLEEIYIFAPKYVIARIIASLDKPQQKKVRMQFYKEYIKYNPLLLLKTFKAELDDIQKNISKTPASPPLVSRA